MRRRCCLWSGVGVGSESGTGEWIFHQTCNLYTKRDTNRARCALWARGCALGRFCIAFCVQITFLMNKAGRPLAVGLCRGCDRLYRSAFRGLPSEKSKRTTASRGPSRPLRTRETAVSKNRSLLGELLTLKLAALLAAPRFRTDWRERQDPRNAPRFASRTGQLFDLRAPAFAGSHFRALYLRR